MYKWLLFDADGTIFDFDKASADALANTFAFAGIPHTEQMQSVYDQINQACWEALERGDLSAEKLRAERFRLLLEVINNHDADPGEMSNIYLKHLGEGDELLPGAQDLLHILHTRIDLLLITNGLAEVQRPRFASTDMSRFFKDIVISDEVGVAKPDTAIFDICFEKMGNPAKSEVMIIGDSLTSDIQGGINYGIDTCWYNPTGKPRPADIDITLEIKSLYDLIPNL